MYDNLRTFGNVHFILNNGLQMKGFELSFQIFQVYNNI